MKKNDEKLLFKGCILITIFALWTGLIQTVDVRPAGQSGTYIGFASLNTWFHKLTGVHMSLYVITDWLGLVPVFICMIFAILGFVQLVKRRSMLKVDYDILILGVYYVLVIFGYLVFEIIPINYRPILINGFMEASYPSSTTLLVLSVMPTLIFQANYRLKSDTARKVICVSANIFSAFMVIGRLISGVHWLTDIIGSIMLSAGLFNIYKGLVYGISRKTSGTEKEQESDTGGTGGSAVCIKDSNI